VASSKEEEEFTFLPLLLWELCRLATTLLLLAYDFDLVSLSDPPHPTTNTSRAGVIKTD
jgi:hypothetical protein